MIQIATQLAELCPLPLTDAQLCALNLLCEAHVAAAVANMNASNQMAQWAGEASVDLKSAFIMSLSVIGGKHAPIEKIRAFLNTPFTHHTVEYLAGNGGVPGWGNSFHKGEPDPAVAHVHNWLAMHRPDWIGKIANATTTLHGMGKHIFPNMGCYTAIIANIINFPNGAELALVTLPRMATWTKLFLQKRNA